MNKKEQKILENIKMNINTHDDKKGTITINMTITGLPTKSKKKKAK